MCLLVKGYANAKCYHVESQRKLQDKASKERLWGVEERFST